MPDQVRSLSRRSVLPSTSSEEIRSKSDYVTGIICYSGGIAVALAIVEAVSLRPRSRCVEVDERDAAKPFGSRWQDWQRFGHR